MKNTFLNLQWDPDPFNQLLNFLAFMQLDFLETVRASCLNADFGIYSNIVLMSSLIPVGLAALILLVYLITFLVFLIAR